MGKVCKVCVTEVKSQLPFEGTKATELRHVFHVLGPTIGWI